MKRMIPLFILIAAAVLFGTTTPSKPNDVKGLTVHEWGTFTSIAGDDGRALEWTPWAGGSSDLPCFVERFKNFVSKASYSATVRMETPVIYFYAPQATTVTVGVRFPNGLITEWFPKASKVSPDRFMDDLNAPEFSSAIRWNSLKVVPNAVEDFPIEIHPNHYYAARQTDAAPVQVGTQKEKFLFYRGVANTRIPVSATINSDGKVLVKNLGRDTIQSVILFESRGGKLGYRMGRVVADQITLDPPSLDADFASLKSALEKTLIAQGLFPKEARAMIATWHDSWFEEGTRLFYVLPRKAVDAMLPLEITPTPIQISRVFVGRIELITAATRAAIKRAIETDDRATLEKYGRFLQPISNRILGKSNTLINTVSSEYLAARASVCR